MSKGKCCVSYQNRLVVYDSVLHGISYILNVNWFEFVLSGVTMGEWTMMSAGMMGGH